MLCCCVSDAETDEETDKLLARHNTSLHTLPADSPITGKVSSVELQLSSHTHWLITRHCLSNAMHGQNINLPVYLCVILSVNSPTGQTPQRIFTVDSLKDVDLQKDVPFGGLDDE